MLQRTILLAAVLNVAVSEPTKSPSTGMHKPTWKPSSKPAEHRQLAGSPTKSPSTGMHKPTWKPSSKPAEHRGLSTREERAEQKSKAEADAAKGDTDVRSATSKSAVEATAEVVELDTKPIDTEVAVKQLKADIKEAKTEVKSADSAPEMKEAEFEVTQAKAIEKEVEAGTAVFVQDTRPKTAAKSSKQTPLLYAVYNEEMENPMRRKLAGSPTKSPSTGMHKPTWKPSSKPAEHRELKKSDDVPAPGPVHVSTPTMTPRTSEKPAEHRVLKKTDPAPGPVHVSTPTMTPRTSEKPAEHRELSGYKAASPTKSPSTGMHKPTWKPSSKPAEHRSLKQDFLQTTPVLASVEETTATDNLEVTAIHNENAVARRDYDGPNGGLTKVSTKPVLQDQQKETVMDALSTYGTDAEAQAIADASKANLPAALYAKGGKVMTSGYKAASPTKSPSTGMHKPTWKPSSKPAEHRELSGYKAASPTKSPSTGMHKPTWKPSSKPAEHRELSGYKAASPTKSPSTGMHKPTWKPSSKPAEHRTLSLRSEKASALKAAEKETKESVEEIKVSSALKMVSKTMGMKETAEVVAEEQAPPAQSDVQTPPAQDAAPEAKVVVKATSGKKGSVDLDTLDEPVKKAAPASTEDKSEKTQEKAVEKTEEKTEEKSEEKTEKTQEVQEKSDKAEKTQKAKSLRRE